MDAYTPNSNSLYQGLVIGLAGGAILVVTLAAVVWRRRRAGAGHASDGPSTEVRVTRYYWVELADGRVVRVRERGRRTKSKGVGRQPLLWDAGLGNRTVAEYDPVEGFDGIETACPDQDQCEKGELGPIESIESDEPFTPAFNPQWKPTSVILPDYTRQVKPEQSLQVSVLIAMPYSQSRSSASSETSSFSDMKKRDEQESVTCLNELDDDTDCFPPLEIGSTLVDVSTEDAGAWQAITADVDARAIRHEAIASRKPGREREERDTTRLISLPPSV